MTGDFTRIEVRPISAALGAEICGVDLGELDEPTFAEIREAFRRHSVIFFRDQDLTPEQHIAFAERWSTININRFFKPMDDYPMIAQVIKEPDQMDNIGGDWHTDHSYDQIPALGSILYAREVPDVGGDTHFASMYKAYEALSPGMQEMLAGLNAWHSSRHVFGYTPTTLNPATTADWETRTWRPKTPCIRSSSAIPRRAARRSTSMPILPSNSTAGRRKSRNRSWIISTNTDQNPSSPAGSNGATVQLPSGTIAPLGTMRSTIITASAASCTASLWTGSP